ncbi:hypothetical protein ALP12_200216 [Pseudomonas savastanoi pv. phaseolicola]|nr:hypothetical protein ALP12_200216 [Pseudomonas savastanoi pv. phaseolicola]
MRTCIRQVARRPLLGSASPNKGVPRPRPAPGQPHRTICVCSWFFPLFVDLVVDWVTSRPGEQQPASLWRASGYSIL